MSASVAVLVTVKLVSSLIVRFVCAGSTGAVLSSFQTRVNELLALRCSALTASGLESVTTVVKVLVLGPWASVGVQEIGRAACREGVVTAAAAVVTDKVKVRVLAGMSGSVGVLVTVKLVRSLIVRFVVYG